jgi:hypothetical protein
MTPEAVVAHLANLVATEDEFTEDTLYTAMSEDGIPDDLADLAFKFTQVAWGRVYLEGLGVRFSPDYLCFNGKGEVVESGHLVDQPHYAAAMRLAPRYRDAGGFARFALMSADVNAVNQALHAGSEPAHLVMSPAAFFLETPNDAAMAKAQKVLAEKAKSTAHKK